MKNTTLSLLCGTLLCLSLVGCALEYIPTEDDLKNKYMVEWIKDNGLIDPNHDWNMATTVTAAIHPETFGEGYTVRVYSAPLERGGVYLGEVESAMEVELNLLKRDTELYVRAYNPEGTHYVDGTYPIVNGRLDIKAQSRASGDLIEDDGSPRSRAQVVDAETTYQWIIACEDLGSTSGTDMDFNDVVIGINYVIQNNKYRLSITPLAAGGIYRATVYLGNEEQDGKPLEANKLFEIHEGVTGYLPSDIATGSYQMYNTSYFDRPGKTHVIERDNNFFNIANNMGDINIWVDFPSGSKLKGAKISAPPIGTSPQMICVTGSWKWPKERRRLVDAYPDFTKWNHDATIEEWTASVDPALVINPNAEPEQPARTVNVPQTWYKDRSINISGSYQYKDASDQIQTVNYTTRPYDVYVGKDAPLTGAPVVFSLHGAYGSKSRPEPLEAEDADYGNFILVVPQGVTQYMPGIGGYATGWNANGRYYDDPANFVDGVANPPLPNSSRNPDVDYLMEIIEDLANSSEFNIDRNRIYVCGFSNGGMMTYSLANCCSNVFAGFASISGFQLNEFRQSCWGYLSHVNDNCTTVPFMHIHGMNDGTVSYGYLGIIRDNMVARQGCNTNGTVDNTVNNSSSRKTVYASGVGNVPYVLYEIAGMGHDPRTTINGRRSGHVIWDFFNNSGEFAGLRSTNMLKTNWNNSLRWSVNPDAVYNGNATSHGWSNEVNGVRHYGTKNASGETSAALNSKLYRSVQLLGGFTYHLKFKTKAARQGAIYVRLQDQNNSSNIPLQGVSTSTNPTGEVVMRFFVGGNKIDPVELKLSICKENTADKFEYFEIYKGWNGPTNATIEGVTFPDEGITPSTPPAPQGWENIPQGRPASDSWGRLTTLLESGDDGYNSAYNTYVATYAENDPKSNCQIAFKTTGLDLSDSDYVVIEFEGAVPSGWFALPYSDISGKTTHTINWSETAPTEIGLIMPGASESAYPSTVKVKSVRKHLKTE